MQQDHLAVAQPSADAACHGLTAALPERVERADAPAHAAASRPFHGACHHRVRDPVGGPEKVGFHAGYLAQRLPAPQDVGRHRPASQHREAGRVAPRVNADCMPLGGHTAYDLRVQFGLAADQEEGRPYAVRPQRVQYARRLLGVGPVVERQRHDAPRRPVAAQAADIRPQPDLVGAVEKGEPRGDYGDNYIHVNSMADTVLPGKSL